MIGRNRDGYPKLLSSLLLPNGHRPKKGSDEIDVKRCSKCLIEKPFLEFHKRKDSRDGLYSACKVCHHLLTNSYRNRSFTLRKNYELKSAYGINLAEVELRRELQDNKCVICDQQKELVVDHNHATGEVRALLCRACNLAIGYFKDNPDTAYAAYIFLGGK